MLIAGQLCDGFELSADLVEEIFGRVGHGDARGPAAETLAERGVVADCLDETKGALMVVRELGSRPFHFTAAI